MAKVAIKSEKLSPFGGFFSIMEQFDSMLSPIIDHQVALWGKGGWSTESDNTLVSTIMIDVSKHFAATKIAIGDYLRI